MNSRKEAEKKTTVTETAKCSEAGDAFSDSKSLRQRKESLSPQRNCQGACPQAARGLASSTLPRGAGQLSGKRRAQTQRGGGEDRRAAEVWVFAVVLPR